MLTRPGVAAGVVTNSRISRVEPLSLIQRSHRGQSSRLVTLRRRERRGALTLNTGLYLSADDRRVRCIVEVYLDIASAHDRIDKATGRLVNIRAGLKIDADRGGDHVVVHEGRAAGNRNIEERSAPVVFVAVLSRDAVPTVGNVTVALLLPLPLTLTVQVFAVTAPVNVIVPSEAWLDSGSAMAVLMPATNIARLIKVFTSYPPS